MKKSFIMGAMLLAAAATYAADQIIDLSTPAAWTTRSVTAGKDAGTISVKSQAQIVGKKMIPVDAKHTYNFTGSVYVPEGKNAGTTYAGLMMYDKNKKYIGQINAVYEPNSATELVEAVKKGSNILKIKANKRWKALGHFWVGFNVQPGKLCKDLSNGPVTAIKTEGDVMTVTLKNKLAKDYAAGTKVRIQKTGSYYYTNIIAVKAKETKFAKELKLNQLWPETAYISPMILVNWSSKVDKKTLETVYKDLKFVIKEIK